MKTINRFQAVLGRDGSIEMSYDQVAAKDAIVGIYPLVMARPPNENWPRCRVRSIPRSQHISTHPESAGGGD